MFAREAELGLGCAGGVGHYAVRVVSTRECDLAARVRHLVHGAERIAEEIFSACIHLRDTTIAVQIVRRTVAKHLSQASIQIEGVIGGHIIYHLTDSITQTVVLICRRVIHRSQPIGGIVGVCVHTIAEQVAVVIPGVGHTVDAGEAIGIIIQIGFGSNICFLTQPVPNRIISCPVSELGTVFGYLPDDGAT